MAKEKKTSPKVCIIWDNEQFPEEILGIATGKVHNWTTFGKCKFDEFDLIYLLAEPIWDQKLRSDFYGFELGKELREKHNVLCPIIFCSFLKQEHFISLKIKGSEILNYPGHYTLQLPDKPDTKNYKGIDKDTLEDINLSLFNAEQIVHNLMHNTEDALPGLIYSLKDKSKDEMKTKASELLSQQLKIFGQKIEQGNETEFDSLCAEFKKSICSTIDSFETKKSFLLSEAQTLRQPFKLYKPQLYNLLPKKMQEGLAEPLKPKRWQVLFIDDDQTNCDVVCEYFRLNGITCHTATDAKNAFTILKEDEEQSKKISMVIADFRLYENGDSLKGKWQDFQGYRILDEIHSNPDFKSHYVYAILTSKTGTIQKRIQKQSKFPILWFSKSDVLGGGLSSFNLFCKELEIAGSHAFLKKRSIPETAIWTDGYTKRVEPGYCYYYKLHIESQDYDEAEKNINLMADDNLKNASEHSVLLNDLDYQCSLIINSKKSNTDILLNKFRTNILLSRRIYWAMSFVYMKNDYEIIKIFKRPNSKPRDIFTSYLGISLREKELGNVSTKFYTFGMLDEEYVYIDSKKDNNPTRLAQIKRNCTDYELLWNFFDDIVEFKEIPLIKTIFDKFPNHDIFLNEIKQCFSQISNEMKKNHGFKERFVNITKPFFKDEVNRLSEGLKEKFHHLIS